MDREAEKSRGVELGRIAVQKGQNDFEALAAGGYPSRFSGRSYVKGQSYRTCDKSELEQCNGAGSRGMGSQYLGQPHEAIQALERSMRLSPRDPTLFRRAALAFAHLFQGEFEEAITGLKGDGSQPELYRDIPSARLRAGAAGRHHEAQAVIQRLATLLPDVSFRTLPERAVFKHSDKLDLINEGLRLAGVPE